MKNLNEFYNFTVLFHYHRKCALKYWVLIFLSMLLRNFEFAAKNFEKNEFNKIDDKFCFSYIICFIYRYNTIFAWLKKLTNSINRWRQMYLICEKLMNIKSVKVVIRNYRSRDVRVNLSSNFSRTHVACRMSHVACRI